jgi:chromosome segregation protein
MILKRLELSGFKSFANKTVLEFPAHVVAIVGPNGSGKSNVIDAVRWLLGERDAKNLRGGKIEDLIFSGTPSRPRAGMAQSALYFDNSSGFFPVEFPEVSISRQISRDGQSTYHLNNSEVRLKDLVDFLAKSRLGSRGLTIIGQGNSDLFIKATPEERRFMIEEILGLREYQIKKTDAVKKMSTTTVNLDKTKALIEEIRPHLKVLRRQTEKWEQRGALERELRDLEYFFFGNKLAEIHKGAEAVAPELGKLEEALMTTRAELEKREKELGRIEEQNPFQKKEAEEIKAKKIPLLGRRSELQKELGRLEVQLEMLERARKPEEKQVDIARAGSLIKKIRQELESFLSAESEVMKEKIHALTAEIDEVFETPGKNPDHEEVKKLKGLNGQALDALRALDEELAAIEKRESELTGELEGFNSVFRKAMGEIEFAKAELARLEAQKNKLLFERERHDLKLNDVRVQLAERELREEDIVKSIRENGLPQVALAMPDVERRMFRLRNELANIGEVDEALIKEYRESDARHEFLTTQAADLVQELNQKIHVEFAKSMKQINEEFNRFFGLMFNGGSAKLKLQKPEKKESVVEEGMEEVVKTEELTEEQEEAAAGIDVEVSLPRKKVSSLEVLSGGERSLVSIAALFALISVSPPPFLVLDEVDAPLDERNARRFSDMLKEFAKKTQFVMVTHNRATMEAADILYGVTLGEDGTSKILSLKLEA